MDKVIKIGTRDSQLALWQAHNVQNELHELGYKTELVPVKSTGDLVLDKPLYELGITGIFTKTLDVAMLNGTVDIAVHSMKDVPTSLPKGIVQTAVLARANTQDILVHKSDINYSKPCTIATGSLRRKAQWLHKYPHHTVVDLRGNVNTRLQKLADNNWDGAIFAKAGLERINVLPEQYNSLDWMTPAPAQGAMVVVALQNNVFCVEATKKLNNPNAQICTQIERNFLRELEGGCTAPIGALGEISAGMLSFKGCLFSLNGKEKITISDSLSLKKLDENGAEYCKVFVAHEAGKHFAKKILDKGGKELMLEIKKEMNT